MPNQTILVIDFDPDSIEAALRFLTEAGYGVEVANDGIAGMEAYEKIRPDLVLIEPMVPKKHGFEVCRDIKDSPGGRQTPVLITTGFYRGKKHHLQAKQQYGCDDYLEKPVSGEALVTACRRFLEGGSERKDSDAFEEMGSEERIPALDNLTEEEIVSHLDSLIVEQSVPAAPAEPAETVDAAELFPDIEKVQPAPPAPVPAPSIEAEPKSHRTPPPEVMPKRANPLRWALPAAVLVIAVAAALYFVFHTAGDGAVEPQVAAPDPAPAEVVAKVEPASLPAAVNPDDQPAAAEVEVAETPQAAVEEVPEEVPVEVVTAEPPPPPPQKTFVPKPRKRFLKSRMTVDTSPLPESAGVGPSVAALPDMGEPLAEPEPPKFLRGDLMDIAEVDSPPVSINKPMPAYHPIARQLRQQGTVVLKLLIDAHGRVERVETVSNDAGPLLEGAALETAKSWTYHPAIKDGVEVKVWKTEQVVFKLDAR